MGFRHFWKDAGTRFSLKWKAEYEETRSQCSPGYVLGTLRYCFLCFHLLSASWWIPIIWKEPETWREARARGYCRIDKYAMAWLGLVAASIVILHWRLIAWGPKSLIITVLLIYRLLDIFQSWVSQFILAEKWQPVNVNRSLVLVFVGYLEITIIGAVLRFTSERTTSFSQVLYRSVMTMVVNPQQEPLSAILLVQIAFAILFVTVVVQHVVGRLSN